MIELQQRFFLKETDTSYIVKELASNNDDGQLGESEDSKTEKTNGNNKRKLETNDDDDEDEMSKDELEDDDDEEIFSDTDEEMRANELKNVKKQKKMANFNYKALNENQIEDYLTKLNKSFQKYR